MKKKVICDTLIYDNEELVLCETKSSVLSEKTKEVFQILNANRQALAYLYEKSILATISDYLMEIKGENPGRDIYFVCDIDKMLPYQAELKERFPENDIFEERTPCIYSGCVSVTSTMSTYRETCGCVGKSWEVGLIKNLDGQTASKIAAVKKALGPVQSGINAINAFVGDSLTITLEKIAETSEAV